MLWINKFRLNSFNKFTNIVFRISKEKRIKYNIEEKILDIIYHLGPQIEDLIKMIVWDLREAKIINKKQEDKIFTEFLKDGSIRKKIFNIISDAVLKWSNEKDPLKKYDIYSKAYTEIKNFLLSQLEISDLKTFPGSDIY